MRTYLLLLLLCFTCRAASAQEYNKSINDAESHIVQAQYREALRCYHTAFTHRKRAFAIDLYNAGACALKAGRSAEALQYCRQLAAQGVGEKFFQRSVYRPLRMKPGWDLLLQEAAAAKIMEDRKHGALVHLIDSLKAKDQRVNHEWRAAGNSADTRRIMDLTYDTIGLHLKHLFDSLGFLTEEQLGPFVENDTILQRGQRFDIIIIHNYTARMTGDTLFNGTLRQALARQLLKPEHYASLRDFAGGDWESMFGTAHHYVQYRCTLYRQKGDTEVYAQIEHNRKRIGLQPLKDYEQKLLYRLRYGKTFFDIYAPISIYGSFKDQAAEKSFLEEQEIVLRDIPGCHIVDPSKNK